MSNIPDDIKRVVKQLIIEHGDYGNKEVSFDEVKCGKSQDGKRVYNVDFTVSLGDGKYDNHWGKIDESDVLQVLREERLNELLKK